MGRKNGWKSRKRNMYPVNRCDNASWRSLYSTGMLRSECIVLATLLKLAKPQSRSSSAPFYVAFCSYIYFFKFSFVLFFFIFKFLNFCENLGEEICELFQWFWVFKCLVFSFELSVIFFHPF